MTPAPPVAAGAPADDPAKGPSPGSAEPPGASAPWPPPSGEATPSSLPRPPGELERLQQAWQPPRGWRLLSSVNNTHVGLFYIGTSLLFFLAAGVLALLMRAQLAVPGQALVSPALYHQLFTMHGTVMMFLFAVPVVEAVAVYLLPGMLGARDLPFPRLSAYAFWAYAFGGLGFFVTIFFGVAPDGGWFMYPPLTGKAHSPGLGADFWLLGIGFIEISAIAGAVELIVGILMTRSPGMTLARMPVFAWAMLVVGLMIVFAFPAIIAGTALLELERAFDWPFFIPERGGDPLLWQHLFWFFGHPEVYIIFLPAAGLVSMMVPVVARTPLVGRGAVIAALVAVGVLSFALWIHHMFTAGLGPWAVTLTSLASLAVALPSGVQVFAWLATLRQGTVQRWTSTGFILGFLVNFTLGGLTGVMVAVPSFDGQVHDTQFVVAHLHYVLVGGMVFPLFAALYHWFPLLRGQPLSERVGRWACGLMFTGLHLTFFPMHLTGLLGMPRRVQTYPDLPGWGLLNALSTAGAAVLAAGVLLVFVDMLRTLRRPSVAHGNPWGADTLEWLPAGHEGLRSMPQVASSTPLWTRPALVHEVPAGAHWLPGNPSGRREALVTRLRDGHPRYLLVLPGDGWLPLGAALGTAGFFLLLTVGWTVSAWACGLVAIGAVWAWLWGLDRPGRPGPAPVARGVSVPLGGDGRPGHALLALWIVLAVDASVFLSTLYAHLHLAMAAPRCPPPGAALLPVAASLAAGAGWLLALLAVEYAQRLLRGPGPWRALRPVLIMVAGFALAGAVVHLLGQRAAGLEPTAQGWSASVAALLALDGLHALTVVLVAGFCWARSRATLLRPRHRAALDVLRGLVWAGALQALVAALVIRGLPVWR